jgi:hypothetical protein
VPGSCWNLILFTNFGFGIRYASLFSWGNIYKIYGYTKKPPRELFGVTETISLEIRSRR